jgi:hypothetical protein
MFDIALFAASSPDFLRFSSDIALRHYSLIFCRGAATPVTDITYAISPSFEPDIFIQISITPLSPACRPSDD